MGRCQASCLHLLLTLGSITALMPRQNHSGPRQWMSNVVLATTDILCFGPLLRLPQSCTAVWVPKPSPLFSFHKSQACPMVWMFPHLLFPYRPSSVPRPSISKCLERRVPSWCLPLKDLELINKVIRETTYIIINYFIIFLHTKSAVSLM